MRIPAASGRSFVGFLGMALAPLLRWTLGRAVGAEHAAVAGLRPHHRVAGGAFPEVGAGISGHGLHRLDAAVRASNRRLGRRLRHARNLANAHPCVCTSPVMTMRYLKHAPEAYFDQDAERVAASISGSMDPETAARAEPPELEVDRDLNRPQFYPQRRLLRPL
jgi:hypothetical protein